MKFLFFTGFAGILGGLALGLISGDHLLGILVSVAGIGTLLFSLPFIMAPFPVYLINPIPLDLRMTLSHKGGEPDDIGEPNQGESHRKKEEESDDEIDPDDQFGLFKDNPDDKPKPR
ncbi:MAG: hypothetical protein Q7S83_00235 [bacterium]|nr:hypothetical protein [bacterium]